MKQLIRLSIRRPVATIMFYLAVLIMSSWSLMDISVDFLPEITVPKLTVICSYGGLPSTEVRELISIPLEDAFSSLKGIKHITSISRDGLCIIELEFHWGSDMLLSGVEAREVIDLAYLTLPEDASKPQVLPVNPADQPVLTVGVFSDDLALARRLAEREIKSRLQQSSGVGTIQIAGGYIDEIHINVDQSFIASKQLSVSEISRSLASGNSSYPAGLITQGSIEHIVKTDGKAHSWQDLGEYYVSADKNTEPIQISHLGVVRKAYRDQRSIFFLDGKEAVLLSIRRQSGASPLMMAKSVKEELRRLEQSYSGYLEFRIIDDTSIIIRESLQGLLYSAALGVFFAFLVLLYFLWNWRNSILLIITLPVSIAWALLLLSISGRSLNIMSLGGLAMGVGMLVDNAIVVMERLSDLKMRRREEVIHISESLASSLCGSTISSLVVFLPLLFLPGLIGALFSDLALAVIFSLTASLAVALSLIPVLFLLWGKTAGRRKRPVRSAIERKMIQGSFRRPKRVFVILLLSLALGVLFFSRLERILLPEMNRAYLRVKVEMPPGTPMASMKRIGAELSEKAAHISWVDNIAIQAGGEANNPYYLADREAGAQILYARVNFNQKAASPKAIEQHLAKALQLNQGIITIMPPADLLSHTLGLKPGYETWLVPGSDPAKTRRKAEEFIEGQEQNWNILPTQRKAQIILYPKRENLAKSGMDIFSLSQDIGSGLFGLVQSSILIDGRDVGIKTRLVPENRDSVDKLHNMNVKALDGTLYKLEDLVEIREDFTLPYLLRSDRKDVTEVQLEGKSSKELKAMLDDLGVQSLDNSLFREHLNSIMGIFALSLILLYLTLGAQFESFFLPLILLLTIPLGFFGVTAALFAARSPLDLNAILGTLVLMGVSVNNSILLYETFQQERKKSKCIAAAIYCGTRKRIRPILMTMLTTSLALLPLAIAPAGKSSMTSMALAIIGGLSVSTMLSLVLIPGIFYWYETHSAKLV